MNTYIHRSLHLAALLAVLLSAAVDSARAQCCGPQAKTKTVKAWAVGNLCPIKTTSKLKIKFSYTEEGGAETIIEEPSLPFGSSTQVTWSGGGSVPLGAKVKLTATVMDIPEGAGGGGTVGIEAECLDPASGFGFPSAATELKIPKPPCGQSAGGSCQKNGSVDVAFALGKARGGREAGDLWIEETSLTGTSYTRKAVRYIAVDGVVAIRQPLPNNQGDALRQVYSGEVLADLLDLPNGFEIRFYSASQVGAMVGGLYTVSGAPFVTWQITDPGPDSGHSRLQVSEIRPGGSVTAALYTHRVAMGRWDLSRGNGQYFESKEETTNLDGSITTEVLVKVNDAQGAILSRHKEQRLGNRLLQSIEGSAPNELVTTYTYDNDQRLTLMSRSDGYYEKTYHDDGGTSPVAFFPPIVVRPIGDLLDVDLSTGHQIKKIYGTETEGASHVEKMPDTTGSQVEVRKSTTILSTANDTEYRKLDPAIPGADPANPNHWIYIPLNVVTTTRFADAYGLTTVNWSFGRFFTDCSG